MAKIHEVLPAVMAEIGAIPKDRKNTQQNFSFRGIDDILNRLHGILAKHKCFLIPKCIKVTQTDKVSKSGTVQVHTTIHMRYKFGTDDGSYECADAVGEALDSSDKSMAKAQSIAFKVACITLFCIPVEGEMPDPDEDQIDPGDENLTRTIMEAVKNCKTDAALNALMPRYQAKQTSLNEAQINALDAMIAEKRKALGVK